MTATMVDAPARAHGLVFTGESVRAILEGRKSQTRRVVTARNSDVARALWAQLDWSTVYVDPGLGAGAYLKVSGPNETIHRVRCRWKIGDRLWVRETWAHLTSPCTEPDDLIDDHVRVAVDGEEAHFVCYRADTPDQPPAEGLPWRPSIFMPRWASRLTLEITDVRVERVQAISEADARAEGIWEYGEGGGWKIYTPTTSFGTMDPRRSYATLWDSINAARGFGWDANPWVWCLTFRRVA